MKCLTIVGARPQFVKAAVVSRALHEVGGVEEVIVHTGQHYDDNMSEIFFEEMCIPKPKYNLGISGMTHGAMTGRMMERIEDVMISEHPDIVLVYGDTDSTLAGALAARKLNIRLAHVEAGLRSFNMRMPEEVNRIVTDRISDVLFCPTQTAVENLKKEGFDNLNSKVILNGDVMQDAALFYAERSCKPEVALPSKFILTTVHRAENTDDAKRLNSIFSALEMISSEKTVVIPLHPRTKAKLTSIGYDFENSKICFIDPVGYLQMIYLLKNCLLVMTDSGGLQKEAYFFNKYCITLRDETEWTELVDNGYNYIAGSDCDKIVSLSKLLLQKEGYLGKSLYGNGDAGIIVAKSILALNAL